MASSLAKSPWVFSTVRVIYHLTERGRELNEALGALGRWAERWMVPELSS